MSNHLRLLTAAASAFLMITVAGCATVIPGKFTAVNFRRSGLDTTRKRGLSRKVEAYE